MAEVTQAIQDAISSGSMTTSMSIWYLVGAMLVFFMQCGFAMVETGFTRSKNAGNIIMKNMLDFCIGAIMFLVIGYGLMMGENACAGLIGMPTLDWLTSFSSFDWGCFFFQLVFAATAATIVSGAMAERTKFISYLIYCVVICAIIYPVEAHWVWGGGFLADMGYVDWAGSSVIHMVGGTAGLIGAAFLGARVGKYDANGKPKAIPGHSITLGALGVFILWFAWYGFNGAAAADYQGLAEILCTTTIATVVATVACMITTWIIGKKPDVSMTLNGALAGLVGITAGCAYVDATGAAIIGLVCGVLVVFSVKFIDSVCKIDDPVGASSVHGVCGAVGTLLVGLFACPTTTNPAGDDCILGLFYGGGIGQLGTQFIGVICILAWAAICSIVLFAIIKHTVGLRVSTEDEIEGLDSTEHGLASSYADFMPAISTFMTTGDQGVDTTGLAPVAMGGGTYSRISIVCNSDAFPRLKDTLAGLGITGMTVSHVMGCGAQKGKTGSYRGVHTSMNLLPKLQVDIVVSEVDPALVVAAARKALNTGEAGDGKIFVDTVHDVMRISTGETGTKALSDELA